MTESAARDDAVGDILVDQFQRLCARADASAEAGAGFAPIMWAHVVAAGFQNAMLPEERGGYGVTPAQAMGLVRAAARLALPLPLAETMMAVALNATLGGDGLAGTLTWSCQAGTAQQAPGALMVTATAYAVPFGRFADQVLVPVACNDLLYLVALPIAQARIEPGQNLAGEPRDTLSWTAAAVPRVSALSMMGVDPDTLLIAGAFVRAQQMVGAMQQALEHALGYAQARHQFGQPIARFQAVQHQLAVAAGHLAAATAAADAAADAFGTPAFAFSVAVAKSRAGEAAGAVAAVCHQVLGAMGFTREHDLHNLTRRLWAWRDEFGNEALWQERIGRAICTAGGARLWETVVDGSLAVQEGGEHGE